MCGIGGILRVWQPGDAPPAHAEAIPEAWLDILDESIKHRGPDGRGRFRQRVVRGDGSVVDVALVHRRLSIIDHADGAQPMLIGNCATGGSPASAAPLAMISREGAPYAQLPTAADHHTCPKCGDGVVAVVFNGCIYNHRELRRELEAAGHVFHTDHSDTEVLLHGWREWGAGGAGWQDRKGLAPRLEGMFAVLCWDSAKGLVYAARDPHAEKPLFWTRLDMPTLAFASSAAGLLRWRRSIGQSATPLKRPLRNWIREGFYDTLPVPVQEMLPRSCGTFDSFESLRQYQCDTEMCSPTGRELRAEVDAIDRLLRQAVQRRIEADVPLVCFLSGGVDSSLIAKFAKESLGDLRTVCVRMGAAEYDESPFATRVAQILGTRHETVDCRESLAEDLPALIGELGLPLGDSSLLPTWWVSRAARHLAPVALAGDGGDELFAGYERHRAAGFAAMRGLRSFSRLVPSRLFPERNPRSKLAKAARLRRSMRAGDVHEFLAIFQWEDIRQLLPGIELGDLNALPLYRQAAFDSVHGADAMLFEDRTEYLPFDLLRKTDTASMRCGLEVRCPMLDSDLSGAAWRLTPQQLMPNGQRKGLLRAVARKYLPPDIVDRPKMGFAIPIGEWFRTDYGGMRQLLYDHLEAADPFSGLAEAGVELNRDFIRQMLREHDAAGERSINPWHGRDHSQRLYMLLVLSIWCRWLRGL